MKTIEWNLLVVGYLFLGGLSAGLFFVSALATLVRRKDSPDLSRIAAIGALMAPWPVVVGCLLLMFDLGRWYRFYKLFLHVQWTSPMSIGSWLLMFFVCISLLYLLASLSDRQRSCAVGWLPRVFRFRWIENLGEWRRTLAMAGLPVSVGIGIYTGVLLGAVQSRPFWNTSLVAQLFLFSALSTGCAALLLGLLWGRGSLGTAEIRLLYTLDIVALSLELFIVLPYVIHGQLSVQAVRDSLQLILGGPFTITFWLFFFAFGLLLPLLMEVREVVPVLLSGSAGTHGKIFAGTAAMLVLAGGFLLRYIFVYAGQISAFR